MMSDHQALLNLPIWLAFILVFIAGLSGEMLRADKDGVRGWSLVRRVVLRSGASVICGVSVVMLLYAAAWSIWVAGAFGCLTAMAGTDVAIGLYERWVAKRIGLEDASRKDFPGDP